MMPTSILDCVEQKRIGISASLPQDSKGANGQYLTPAAIARFMASLFENQETREIRLLDPGAGAGALLAAFLDRWCSHPPPYGKVSVTAYEIDPYLLSELGQTMAVCADQCLQAGLPASFDIIEEDFVLAGSKLLTGDLFSSAGPPRRFTHAILNPPYRKIHSQSEHRRGLSRAGIETSNLYTAFLAIAVRLLEPGGELVAITPRSFCNGPYFLPFRRLLLSECAFRRIHIFHSRESAFGDDQVLQENIIFHLVKKQPPTDVIISSSNGPVFDDLGTRQLPVTRIIGPDDRNLTIHIPASGLDDHVLDRVAAFSHTLADLGLEVATGPVVDFRMQEFIRGQPDQETVPLVYPAHFEGSLVSWPLSNHRKPNAIALNAASRPWLMPRGYYVLTRRFSAKEEKRRIVAALYDPTRVQAEAVGFENHLNVFHSQGKGLEEEIARGLVVYLNSTLVDLYFRQFSGHTQVNAADLRMLPYPGRELLARLGMAAKPGARLSQSLIDDLLESSLQQGAPITTPDPVRIVRKIEEARSVLRSLQVPKAAQDDLLAQYLLALLALKPDMKWREIADPPLLTHHEILDFIARFYGQQYDLAGQLRNGTSRLRVLKRHRLIQLACTEGEIGQEVESAHLLPDVVELLTQYGTGSWDAALDRFRSAG